MTKLASTTPELTPVQIAAYIAWIKALAARAVQPTPPTPSSTKEVK